MKRFTILTIDAIQSLWQNTILGGTTTSSGESAGLTVAEISEILVNLANERGAGLAGEFGVGVDECNASILNAATGAQAVSLGNPALLFGVLITTQLVGTLTITGLTNVAGTAADIVIASGATAPAGTYIDFKGAKCATALICELATATDDVIVFWRKQL